MDILYNSIKSIVVYLMLVTVIMNLLGNNKYKKYVGIFTGMILILIVVNPIMKLFHLTERMDYNFDWNSLKVEADSMKGEIEVASDKQKKEILAAYRSNQEEQIKKIMKTHDVYPNQIIVTMDDNFASEEFGSVLAIEVTASLQQTDREKEEKEEDEIVKQIKPIVIDPIVVKEPTQSDLNNDSQATDSILELTIKKDLSNFYNIDIKNIIVRIQG